MFERRKGSGVIGPIKCATCCTAGRYIFLRKSVVGWCLVSGIAVSPVSVGCKGSDSPANQSDLESATDVTTQEPVDESTIQTSNSTQLIEDGVYRLSAATAKSEESGNIVFSIIGDLVERVKFEGEGKYVFEKTGTSKLLFDENEVVIGCDEESSIEEITIYEEGLIISGELLKSGCTAKDNVFFSPATVTKTVSLFKVSNGYKRVMGATLSSSIGKIEAVYTFVYQKDDSAQAGGEVVQETSVLIDDKIPPEISFTSAPLGVSDSNNVMFGIESDETISKIVCTIDKLLTDKCVIGENEKAASLSLSGLSEGHHEITVRVEDSAGNKSNELAYDFTVDRPNPGHFAITAPIGKTKSINPSVTWTSAGENYQYEITVATDADCELPVRELTTNALNADLSGLTEREYFICANAFDAADNTTSATNAGVAFSIDVTRPQVAISATPPASQIILTTSYCFTFTWASSTPSDVVAFRYGLTGTVLSNNQDTSAYICVPDGTYEFQVTAVDGAGNESTTDTFEYIVQYRFFVTEVGGDFIAEDRTTSRTITKEFGFEYQRAAASACTDLIYAGFSDWYLPNTALKLQDFGANDFDDFYNPLYWSPEYLWTDQFSSTSTLTLGCASGGISTYYFNHVVNIVSYGSNSGGGAKWYNHCNSTWNDYAQYKYVCMRDQ